MSGCTPGTVPIFVDVEFSPIEEALAEAESAVGDGRGLAGTGFWPAVAKVKRRPELADRYAERIAVIDRTAFENWALIVVGIVGGTVLMVLASLAGIGLIGMAYFVAVDMARVAIFYVGFGILLVTTHGLAHLVAGRLAGIRFTHWFIGTIGRPQPGVKVDYASYLRTDAMARAWMHASGALVTKTIPFLLVGAAVAANLPAWAVWGLVAIGVVSIVTDVLWSTMASDWKKFSRERAVAQELSSDRGIDPSR